MSSLLERCSLRHQSKHISETTNLIEMKWSGFYIKGWKKRSGWASEDLGTPAISVGAHAKWTHGVKCQNTNPLSTGTFPANHGLAFATTERYASARRTSSDVMLSGQESTLSGAMRAVETGGSNLDDRLIYCRRGAICMLRCISPTSRLAVRQEMVNGPQEFLHISRLLQPCVCSLLSPSAKKVVESTDHDCGRFDGL